MAGQDAPPPHRSSRNDALSRYRQHRGHSLHRCRRAACDLRRAEDHQFRAWRMVDHRSLLRCRRQRVRPQPVACHSLRLPSRSRSWRYRRTVHRPASVSPATRCHSCDLGSWHRHRPAHHALVWPRRAVHPGATTRHFRSVRRRLFILSPFRHCRRDDSRPRLHPSFGWDTAWSFRPGRHHERNAGTRAWYRYGKGAARHFHDRRRPCRLGRRAARAADERRSQYGCRLADGRIHAGDGSRLLFRRACCRLSHLRGCSSAGQHLFQSYPRRHHRGRPLRRHTAHTPERICPCLINRNFGLSFCCCWRSQRSC
ncbi:hypothetical protein RHSP_63876 [Rhizobium freirei PRF 81]|uniref:Uncharacterized protein n=1 Tax=Rhizobium freirei PRF 81 TaxID=363754 RepID=N6UB72_9HYPH|nr:hypothetical protein RHSP_63876 [Rhizobium freirei PRF 81]